MAAGGPRGETNRETDEDPRAGSRPMGQTALGEGLRKVEAEMAAGRPEQALALSQEMQAHYPRALAVQRALGEVYLKLRKQREALGALERALAGDPEDARALCARAVIHEMHGDSMSALAWYRRACDVRPEDQVLRATYGQLAAHLGQPPYRPSRVGLARLYLRGDLLTHALREWETLVAEQPDLLEAQVGLAETLWRMRRPGPAEELCRRIVANAPACVKALLLLAALLLGRGQPDEARRHVQRAAELDPDRRIAVALFSDQLAAGDRSLRALLLGDQAQGAAGQRAADSASRTLASLTPTGTLSSDLQHIFSETEYMLWGPDEETRARAALAARAGAEQAARAGAAAGAEQARAQQATTGQPRRTAPPLQPRQRQTGPLARPQTNPPAGPPTGPLGRPGQFVPPALVEHGANMDETESRASLDWLRWLQSQGARMHPDMLAGAPAAASGVRAGTQPPAAARPANPSRPSGRGTGPLAPSTEALRAMFAELGPGASGASTGAPAAGAVGGGTGWDSAANAPAGWLADDAAPGASLAPRPGRQETETQRLAQAHALSLAGGGGPPPDAVTLESLERQFASSGFLQVEPQPGLLAAMTAGDSGIGAAPPDDTAGLPPGIADDYPGRLRLAHTWRAEGRLDDALAQYRAILKQAPDLLPDVLRELEECVREAPSRPGVHRLLGDARIQQGDYLGALEAYNRAVALTQPDGA